MFNRPICNIDTPDPWMIEHHDRFYFTFTAGDRVEIWSSHVMDDFNNCQKSTIWKPSPGSPFSADVWAPELHYINKTWYVYVACANPGDGNISHRTIVLRSTIQDPMDPSGWSSLGPLRGMPDHWNIDATVFELDNRLYCCYSGWPLGDTSDTQQDLFLVEMISPEAVKPETLITISKPTLPWEIVDNHGVNEGPQFLLTPHFTGIIYSACGSWTNKYCLAALQLTGPPETIMEPSSWTKWDRPLMQSDPECLSGPFGPGHASFVHERGGSGRVFCVYHATGAPTDGWNNRKAHIYCLEPEIFLSHTQPLICGRMTNVGVGTVSDAGPTQRKSSMFDKMKDKVKNKLREL